MKVKPYRPGPPSRAFIAAPLLALSMHLLPCTGLAQTAPPSADGLDFSDATYPVVITPTRLRQSLADVPASITVITAETLRRHGITRVEEALRLVPGMHVTRASGNDYQVNYHGTRSIAPRRLNVLVDGVSAYLPAFSQMEWTLLPVSIEDIDRIEVIRGPDSAAYGPNSMMAVVNILTHHPKDIEPLVASVSSGSHGSGETIVRLANTIGGTSVRVTARSFRDGGYDHANVNDILTGARVPRPAHDGTETHQLTMRAEHELADGSSLNFSSAYLGTKLEREYVATTRQESHPDGMVNSAQLSARWTKALSSHHEFQFNIFHAHTRSKQQWRTCWPPITLWPESAALFRSNPRFAYRLATFLVTGQGPFPSGATPADMAILADIAAKLALPENADALTSYACGTTDQSGHEARTQVELQDTFVASDTLRVVGGLGWRAQSATSRAFFNGSVHNEVSWLFGHMEWRALPWLTANLGGYGESNSLSSSTFSPRMALNARLSDTQTLRAVVSRGTRTPDLFEEQANWRSLLTDLRPAVRGSTSAYFATEGHGSPNLASEQNWSRELGYLLQLPRHGFMMDVRVFDERLNRLISEILAQQDFSPDNDGSVRLTGWETQAHWDVSPRWAVWMNYGYLLNRRASHAEEKAQYSRHSGSLGLSVALAEQWRASLAHYSASGDGINESGYARTDLTLLHDFSLGAQRGSASLTLSHLDTPTTQSFRSTEYYYTATFESRLGVQLRLRMAF